MGISSLLGWPFAILMGVPIGIDIIYQLYGPKKSKKTTALKITNVLQTSLLTILIILTLSITCDYYYYKKIIIAVINIAIYNAMGTGANIYGTESWLYYLKNLFLNFNLMFILSVLVPILSILHKKIDKQLIYKIVTSYYLWLFIMWIQPHKEERFLYIIYPLLCICAAISLSLCTSYKWIHRIILCSYIVLGFI